MANKYTKTTKTQLENQGAPFVIWLLFVLLLSEAAILGGLIYANILIWTAIF